MTGCVFAYPGQVQLVVNRVRGKKIELRTSSSFALSPRFFASVIPGEGSIDVESDLAGLR
jgi:hypothetical protein